MKPTITNNGYFASAMYIRLKDVAMVFCVSSILAFVSHATSYAELDSSINNQFALLRGEPLHFADGQVAYMLPFYNRILYPGVFWIIAKIFGGAVPLKTLFTLLRFTTYFVCLFAIFHSLKSRLDGVACKYDQNDLLIVFGFSLIPSYFHPGLPGGDIIDFSLCFAMFLFVIEEKFLLAFVIACLTATNRETGSFAGVLYLALYYGREGYIKCISKASLLLSAPYILAIIIRRSIANVGGVTGQMETGVIFNIDTIITWLKNPSPIGWLPLLFCMFFLSIFVFVRSGNMIANRIWVLWPWEL